MDERKKTELKALGFTDEMIAAAESSAAAREKSGDDAGIAFKSADAPVEAAPVEVVVEAAEDATPDTLYFSDLSLDEAQAQIAEWNKPVLDAIAALTGQTATKAAREEETQVALKTTQDAITQLQSTLKADREAVDAKLTTALKSIAELQGDVPAGIKRASQSDATIATKEQVDAFKGPAADPMNDFMSFIQTGTSG